MNPDDLIAMLPHMPNRYRLPLVDRVLEITPGASIRGLKNVTMNEPYFQGHFPNYPVMPGVLVLEALVQLSAWLLRESGTFAVDGTQRLRFHGIETCRFKRQVTPGDQLMLESDAVVVGPGAWRFDVRARVDGQLAAEAALNARLEAATPDADA